MTQTLDALTPQRPDRILCSYHNPSSDLQIARISNISHWYFERVVFPGDVLLFEAVAAAKLEIYSGNSTTTQLAENIPCERLQIEEPPASYNVFRSMSLNSMIGGG